MDGGWMEMDAAIYPPRAHKGTQVGQKRNSKNGGMGDGFLVKQPTAARPQGHASRWERKWEEEGWWMEGRGMEGM